VRRRGPLFLGVAALVLAVCGSDGGATWEATSPLSGTASAPAPIASSAPTLTLTPTPTTTPPPTPQPVPREFTIVATGDVLLHERLWVQAQRDADPDGDWDFAPQLASIKPVVSAADLAICHLETPLAPEDGPYEGYPVFSSPPQIVPALVETGYAACTTASNHTFDQGGAGVDRTLDYLDDVGLGHTGSARTQDEAAEPTLIEVETGAGTVTVGLLSYTYAFNGIPYPGGHPWRSNLIDEDAILAEAAAARAGGAEFVILAMHWGDEYRHDPNPQQLELAPRLIKSADVDMILGHHAHVVQPLEYFDGEWVVYGMGNLMAAHRTPGEPQNEGLLVRFTITEDLDDGGFTTTGAEYLPLLQTDAMPVSVVNVPVALDGGEAGTATTVRIDKAMDRTTEVVGRRDAFGHGLGLID
jgi:poly-gamma-glutamate synthesis protein (capsule biosynthesis protein)